MSTTNDHKRPQTTNKRPTNHHKLPQTMSKRPQTTTKHQQKTTNYQQTNTNYQQTTTNGHPFTSNQKSEGSFLLPPPGNYKELPDFEKYTLQCQTRGGGGGGPNSWEGSDKGVNY